MLVETITDIVNKYKRIGVFVSGGFDSGLLLYILNLVKKDNEIEIFILSKHPKSVEHAQPVIEFVSKKLGIHNNVNILDTYNIKDYTVEMASHIAISRYKLDVVLTGCVKPPDHLDIGNNILLKSTMTKIQQPFNNVTKDFLIREAKDLGVLELTEVSNSCEVSYHNPCMQCFHCLEKDWAMKQVL